MRATGFSTAKNRKASSKSLRSQIAELERKIGRGAQNILLADPEDVPALNQTLSEWRARRSDLVKQLKQTESVRDGKKLVDLRGRVSHLDQSAESQPLSIFFPNATL